MELITINILLNFFIFIVDLTKHIVSKYNDIEKLMDVGNSNRLVKLSLVELLENVVTMILQLTRSLLFL